MAGTSKNAKKKGTGKPVSNPTKRMPNKSTKKGMTTPMWIGLGVLGALALVAFYLLGRGNAGALPTEVSAADAFAMREAGAFMLDVREVDEWEDYHMPGATLIPQGQLSDRLNELPKDQEIVVVCRSGNRSAAARDALLAAGFTDVTSMAGGMLDWQAAGYPVVSGP